MGDPRPYEMHSGHIPVSGYFDENLPSWNCKVCGAIAISAKKKKCPVCFPEAS